MKTITRRTALQWLNSLLVVLAFPFTVCKTAIAERFPTRTVEKANFSFDPSSGMIRWTGTGKEEPYALVVGGLVAKPITLTYRQLRALPSASQVSDFHCVEGWTLPHVKWSGFRFNEIVDQVKPLPEARYVIFHSLGETTYRPQGQKHYLESFETASLVDPKQEILMALDKDGKPLSRDRGAPLRVVAPYRFAYKSIKFVHRVEFAKKKRLGWWTLADPVYDWRAYVYGGSGR